MPEVFRRAKEHQGASFVEIFQNCIVFNDAVFADFTNRDVAAEKQLNARHGEPLLFGKEMDKGLSLNRDKLALEVIKIGENGHSIEDVLVHDETNPILAQMLTNLHPPDFPMVLGVLFCDPAESFEAAITGQIKAITEKKPDASLAKMMQSGRTWEVK